MKIILVAVAVLTVSSLRIFAETNSAPTSPATVVDGSEITGQEKKELLSKIGGIGIGITPVADGVLVEMVFPDTPACEAAMKAGDIVTHIDSKPIKGLKLHEVVDQMRGAVGSEVELLVSRRGQMEPITLNLVRREILFHKHRASCE
jgi:carboxyl-terminal processing protease